MSEAIEATRDIRIDRIGLVQELGKLWTDPMKDKVKADMMFGKFQLATGDLHEGRLSTSIASTIDPVAFFKLFNSGKVSRKDFLSAIRVSREAVKEFMSAREIDDISTSELPTMRLNIVRRKGITFTLQQAIDGIRTAAADLS